MPTRSTPLRLLLCVLTLTVAGPALAQLGDLRLPISLDADATDYDGKSSMLMFRGLRLSQGNIGVEADHGRASKLDFEDSVWQFSGNVRIDTGQGRIRCDTADLRFAGHQLRIATINGTPATFELRRANSDELTYGEAGRLKYDFGSGIVEFSENATITEGGNRISSNFLVYNIAEQRINADSGGGNGEKVKIIYTPGVDGPGVPPAAGDGQSGGADVIPPGEDDKTEQATPPPAEQEGKNDEGGDAGAEQPMPEAGGAGDP